ncbi:MAG: hypothetical protein FWD59_10475, partial [Micrococcales bacterium]|nr:hypothetical protein [Micrococcales bacterium]
LYMVPIDNPLGGEFPMLSNSYAFQLNGEPLFPSSSFVYLSSDGRVPRYDVDELSRLLAWYGHDTAAQALLAALNPADVSDIVGKRYLKTATLAALGIETGINVSIGSHTSVAFTIK